MITCHSEQSLKITCVLSKYVSSKFRTFRSQDICELWLFDYVFAQKLTIYANIINNNMSLLSSGWHLKGGICTKDFFLITLFLIGG